MNPIPNKWITLLFLRFKEIYGDDWLKINQFLPAWQEALNGLNAEQIKKGLEICRTDPSVLPTPVIFAALCKQEESISDNCNASSPALEACGAVDNPHSIVPLQWPTKSLQAPRITDNQQLMEWQQKLMIMDEKEALLTLSGPDRYDRNRLLMEKQGREQVARLQALASGSKPEVKRKDWE